MRSTLSKFLGMVVITGCVAAVGSVVRAADPAGACYAPPTVTCMVPVEKIVQVPQGRWVTERRLVPTSRTVYVNEPYTVNETRYVRRPVTRTRMVTRTVVENEFRTVNRKVCETVCDPATGRNRNVNRTISETVSVPVRKKICVEQPYTAYVREKVSVPVTKTRRVAKCVQETREVCERRYVTEMVPQRVTVMQPVVQTCNG